MEFPVLYEDANLLAVDKPAGVPSVDHARGERSPLVQWLRERYPETQTLGEGPRPAGQVHRLDTATSGVLVIARTAAGFARLREAFGEAGVVEKVYEALLVGEVAKSLHLRWPIGARGRRAEKVRVVRDPARTKGLRGVRPASTEIAPLRTSKVVSWCEIKITTGVRHQIRAHAAAAGHPVVGDPLYGKEAPKACEARLYLHAARVCLRTPSGESLRVESPIPSCFGRCFEILSDAPNPQ